MPKNLPYFVSYVSMPIFIEIVTKTDANKLADALEKALMWDSVHTIPISKTGMKKVIDLCRQGAFEII